MTVTVVAIFAIVYLGMILGACLSCSSTARVRPCSARSPLSPFAT